jgi:hypothetical protein
MKRRRLSNFAPALLLAVVAVPVPSRAAGPPEPPKLIPSPPPVTAPATPAVPAMLTVEKEQIDLGDVVRGAKAEATFVLKNAGKVPVKILSARPG